MNARENAMVIGNAEAFPELSDVEADELDAQIEQSAARMLKNADWWNEQLNGYTGTAGAIPRAMSLVMESLDDAIKGDRIAVSAVLGALSVLQRAANTEALEQAECEVEA